MMDSILNIRTRNKPPLDPEFVPAALWRNAYHALVKSNTNSTPLVVALVRPDKTCSAHKTMILPNTQDYATLNIKYVERLIKTLLWQKGGNIIIIGGNDKMAADIKRIYSSNGEHSFDSDLIGKKIFGSSITVESRPIAQVPPTSETSSRLGRNLDGCRIGFDLGGSDRKCAALIDGKVIHSEEVAWDPYYQSDPQYHINGINDSIRRAAEKLPRVDAIGGSAAGVYINNEPRVGSLFRGLSNENFDKYIRNIFRDLQKQWGNVPFEIVNDGEVTALAASMAMNDNSVLGVSMGTSQAAGYIMPDGSITCWLNELAFVPVDYRSNAPVDEWSGDIGCGVQYFSQQAVARLAPIAGINVPKDMPMAEILKEVQNLMVHNDKRARNIYETIGTYLGYSTALYAEIYDIKNLLILGRVTSGEGGTVIISKAEQVLKDEFPILAEKIKLCTPNEQEKRHGQAIAAASLPRITQ